MAKFATAAITVHVQTPEGYTHYIGEYNSEYRDELKQVREGLEYKYHDKPKLEKIPVLDKESGNMVRPLAKDPITNEPIIEEVFSRNVVYFLDMDPPLIKDPKDVFVKITRQQLNGAFVETGERVKDKNQPDTYPELPRAVITDLPMDDPAIQNMKRELAEFMDGVPPERRKAYYTIHYDSIDKFSNSFDGKTAGKFYNGLGIGELGYFNALSCNLGRKEKSAEPQDLVDMMDALEPKPKEVAAYHYPVFVFSPDNLPLVPALDNDGEEIKTGGMLVMEDAKAIIHTEEREVEQEQEQQQKKKKKQKKTIEMLYTTGNFIAGKKYYHAIRGQRTYFAKEGLKKPKQYDERKRVFKWDAATSQYLLKGRKVDPDVHAQEEIQKIVGQIVKIAKLDKHGIDKPGGEFVFNYEDKFYILRNAVIADLAGKKQIQPPLRVVGLESAQTPEVLKTMGTGSIWKVTGVVKKGDPVNVVFLGMANESGLWERLKSAATSTSESVSPGLPGFLLTEEGEARERPVVPGTPSGSREASRAPKENRKKRQQQLPVPPLQIAGTELHTSIEGEPSTPIPSPLVQTPTSALLASPVISRKKRSPSEERRRPSSEDLTRRSLEEPDSPSPSRSDDEQSSGDHSDSYQTHSRAGSSSSPFMDIHHIAPPRDQREKERYLDFEPPDENWVHKATHERLEQDFGELLKVRDGLLQQNRRLQDQLRSLGGGAIGAPQTSQTDARLSPLEEFYSPHELDTQARTERRDSFAKGTVAQFPSSSDAKDALIEQLYRQLEERDRDIGDLRRKNQKEVDDRVGRELQAALDAQATSHAIDTGEQLDQLGTTLTNSHQQEVEQLKEVHRQALEQADGNVSVAEKQRDDALGQVNTLTDELGTRTTERDQARDQVTTLTAQRNTARAQVITLTNERDAARGQIVTLTGQVGTLTTQVGTLPAQVATLQAQVAALAAQNATANRTIQDVVRPQRPHATPVYIGSDFKDRDRLSHWMRRIKKIRHALYIGPDVNRRYNLVQGTAMMHPTGQAVAPGTPLGPTTLSPVNARPPAGHGIFQRLGAGNMAGHEFVMLPDDQRHIPKNSLVGFIHGENRTLRREGQPADDTFLFLDKKANPPHIVRVEASRIDPGRVAELQALSTSHYPSVRSPTATHSGFTVVAQGAAIPTAREQVAEHIKHGRKY
ncbi:MAG: hypothetical protein V4568_16235 [Pseudomonadota bacterium]